MLLFYRLIYAICCFIIYECDVRHNTLEIAVELMEQGHIVFLTQSARFCTSLDELSMSGNTLGVRVRAAQPSYSQRAHLAHVFGGVSLLSPRCLLYMRQDHTSRRETACLTSHLLSHPHFAMLVCAILPVFVCNAAIILLSFIKGTRTEGRRSNITPLG